MARGDGDRDWSDGSLSQGMTIIAENRQELEEAGRTLPWSLDLRLLACRAGRMNVCFVELRCSSPRKLKQTLFPLLQLANYFLNENS